VQTKLRLDARLKEIKSEILNSEKAIKNHTLKIIQHLEALKHDKVLHPSKVQPHEYYIPSYLVCLEKVR
jgi:ATP-dependent RNA helicase DDX56/DBP9